MINLFSNLNYGVGVEGWHIFVVFPFHCIFLLFIPKRYFRDVCHHIFDMVYVLLHFRFQNLKLLSDCVIQSCFLNHLDWYVVEGIHSFRRCFWSRTLSSGARSATFSSWTCVWSKIKCKVLSWIAWIACSTLHIHKMLSHLLSLFIVVCTCMEVRKNEFDFARHSKVPLHARAQDFIQACQSHLVSNLDGNIVTEC